MSTVAFLFCKGNERAYLNYERTRHRSASYSDLRLRIGVSSYYYRRKFSHLPENSLISVAYEDKVSSRQIAKTQVLVFLSCAFACARNIPASAAALPLDIVINSISLDGTRVLLRWLESQPGLG